MSFEISLSLCKLAAMLSCGFAFGAIEARSEELYCRVTGADGVPTYGRVGKGVVHLLDAAPWLGGRPTGRTLPLDGARFLPPSEPRNVLALANSYVGKEKTPPRYIRWFAKSAGSVATDGDVVEIPPVVDQLKTEAELVLVVGRRLRNATEAEARDAVFGYAAGNELFGFSESFQKVNGEDPARTEVMLAAGLKLGDRFSPFGPFIRRGGAWPLLKRRLLITNAATGKRVEALGDTSGILYSPEKILSELSRVLTLEPGDVIFTGTDKAQLVDAGDEVTIEFEGLGRLANRVVRP
jgi:2-keto-4-pentenoate hydratase/2-oxohepta-3-ene-1,7-dioic acid hydratase in catechol pathway